MAKKLLIMIPIIILILLIPIGNKTEIERTEKTEIERLEPIPTLPEKSNLTADFAENPQNEEIKCIKTTEETTIDIYALDVWDLANYLYGIDELTTTRMLKLITVEGYEADPTLDYYCACACVTRARFPDNFMGSNIYERFGELDSWYGDWMDSLGIADHAYTALRGALLDFQYVNQCNGMATPYYYIYYSDIYGIYVWN